MSPFDIPFTALAELPEPAPKARKAPVKRGANPKTGKKPPPKPVVDPAQPAAAPSRSRNWKEGQYTPNPAMKLALARAREAQPHLITMSGSETDGQPKEYPK